MLNPSHASSGATQQGQRWQRRLIHFLGEQGFILIFVLWAVYLTLNTQNFATTDNILTILRQATIVGIAAIGAHFVILMGLLDLSVAAIISLSGVVMAQLMIAHGSRRWLPGW